MLVGAGRPRLDPGACSIDPCTFAPAQGASIVDQIMDGIRHTAEIRSLELTKDLALRRM